MGIVNTMFVRGIYALCAGAIFFLFIPELTVAGDRTVGAASSATDAEEVSKFVPNEIIVVYDSEEGRQGRRSRRSVLPGVSRDTAKREVKQVLVERGAGKIAEQDVIDPGDVVLLSFDGDVDIQKVSTELEKVDGVAYAQPNFLYSPASTPDPITRGTKDGGGWSGNSIFDVLALGEVYKFIPPGKSIPEEADIPIIAIIDGAIKTSHPEFAGRLWAPKPCFDDKGKPFSPGCSKGGFGIKTTGFVVVQEGGTKNEIKRGPRGRCVDTGRFAKKWLRGAYGGDDPLKRRVLTSVLH